MLNELRFVQGAVAKKDFIPAMTHFEIKDGEVRAYNGSLALCSPIPFDLECKPKAIPLVRAIGNCTETIQLSLTSAGRLRVQSGGFRAFIDCTDDLTPHVGPEGEDVELDGEALLRAFTTLSPFIGDDASRPWSNGVLLQGASAFATNNVTLVEYWAGTQWPRTVNVPRAAIKEALRIGEPPTRAQFAAASLTLHYENGRWLRTQLLEPAWPNTGALLDVPSTPQPLPDALFQALEAIAPFEDKLGRIYFRDGAVHTHAEEDLGAVYEVPGLVGGPIFNRGMLLSLRGAATTIDFGPYPKPAPFFGNQLRGLIIGMRG